MRTAVVSDLHLGALGGLDLGRRPDLRAHLLETVSQADRLVLLGDVLELRERAVGHAVELVLPFFEALGQAFAGRRVVVVPGNHDHGLGEPWLSRMRLDGATLGPDNEWPVEPGDGLAGRLAAAMPGVEVTLSYPGLRLRSDVYATHGHYLDLPLTMPRLESIAAAAMGRITGRGRTCADAAEYEAVLSPMYAFYGGLAQAARPQALARGGTASRGVWRAVNGRGRTGSLLLGRVALPAAVGALNALGLGPFHAEFDGPELRRSGLRAMGEVADALAPGAAHVVFGHTHRPGAMPGDDIAEWTSPRGARLWNTGSWFLEPAFVDGDDRRSPYWPGTVLLLDETGPPRLENALAHVALA